jgi:hypothetical protein
MPLPGMSFPIWRIMNVVAIAACVLGIAAAFLDRSHSSDSVITAFVSSILIPILVIFGRRLPLETVGHVMKMGILSGLPFAVLPVLLGIVLNGGQHFIQFLGASLLMMLTFVWFSLIIAAFQSTRPFPSSPDRPSSIDHSLCDLPENVHERH